MKKEKEDEWIEVQRRERAMSGWSVEKEKGDDWLGV